MGYEVIGTAIFGAAFLWASMKDELGDNWRRLFFYLTFVEFVLMIGFSMTTADILRGVAIFSHLLIVIALLGMEIFSNTIELWVKTR